MSTDLVVINALPARIVALNEETLDEAMALCERAHAIVIPDAALDEHGARSAHAAADGLYQKINALAKGLEQQRLAKGREISAVKEKLDEIVKAAVVPLNHQRALLGDKVMMAQRAIEAVVEKRRQEAAAEKARQEAEARRAAEEAERQRQAAERAAAEAKRKEQEAAERAAAFNVDLPPDDPVVVAAEQARLAAEASQRQAEQARTEAFQKVFEPAPTPYVPPAPKSSMRTSTSYDLEILDLAAVPREVGGVPMFTFDRAAALRMAKELDKHGKAIPGLRLIKTETTASKGRTNAYEVG